MNKTTKQGIKCLVGGFCGIFGVIILYFMGVIGLALLELSRYIEYVNWIILILGLLCVFNIVIGLALIPLGFVKK